MAWSLWWTAVRGRPFSTLLSLALGVVWGAFLRVPAPLVLLLLLAWPIGSLASIEAWLAFEPFLIRRLGGRRALALEGSQLQPALQRTGANLWVAADSVPWLGISIRALVISRGLLDLVEHRGLVALLEQATIQQRMAGSAGELVVWLGNLPLVGVWWLSRGLGGLGWLLAASVGRALIVPALLCPDAFARGLGRLFTLGVLGLLGAALLSHSFASAGLALLVAWWLVPSLRALLAWETRRQQAGADRATVAAGLGPQLLEALERLACAGEPLPPTTRLGVLARPGAALPDRIERIRAHLAG